MISPSARIFENKRSNEMLISVWQTQATVQAGTPMTVTEEGPLQAIQFVRGYSSFLLFLNILAEGEIFRHGRQ